MQFDWLLARQSKCDLRNLSFMHNPTAGTQDQNRYDMDRTFERVFEFSVQETSKDLSQTGGKHIVLKPEPKKLPLESSP